ncbi:MAG: hypothetical protein J5998_10245 [Clostridia bacterium]|nr:hypothetical protein [Clostridia bacterium]
MPTLFGPGVSFESGQTYLADKPLYEIGLADTRPRERIIHRDAVPVAFELRDLSDVTIDLGGATLLFNGRILPFVLENCRNVTLRNFTIDYRRAAYTQADILEAYPDRLVLRICEGFPCVFRDGEAIPVDGGAESNLHDGEFLMQPFDAVTRAPAYGAGCILAAIGSGKEAKNPPLAVQRLKSELRGDGAVIWHGRFPSSYRAGQVLAFTCESRATPAIYACDCENVIVEHVRMKRVAGFGIHGYFCRDFTVRDMVLKVDDGSNELVSINADGVHMIGLSGRLLIEDCVFENMLDDGGNFHGYFTPVSAVAGDRVVASLDFHGGASLAWHRIFRPGQTLTVYRGNTIAVKGAVRVREADYPDDSRIELLLEGDTGIIRPGDHLENHEAMPEITIRRCRTGRNRPRGFLLSSWRKTVVEDCHFYNCSSAIDFTGDTNYWHESGPVNDVTIRRCVFENCGYCGGPAPITAGPNFEPCGEAPCYHRGITVEDSAFICFDDAALSLRYCDGVTYRNNRFIHSMAYPRRRETARVLAEHCLNLHIEEDKPL